MSLLRSISFLLGISILGIDCTVKNAVNNLNPPNIIFILTDDQRWDAIGYAGNDIIHTPEMDRLAREGAYFHKAFVTTPICAASRASILSGLYERTHDYTFRQPPLAEKYMSTSYPTLLRENGYHTGFFGKFGVKYERLDSLFNESEYYGLDYSTDDRTSYFYKTIGEDTVHLTRYTGHRAEEFIRDAPADKPFCLSLSFNAPHAADSAPQQYFWQDKSNDLYEDVSIPPPLLADDQYFESLPKEVREGFNRVRWYWRYDTPEKYQHSVKGYYRMISEIDDEIGNIRAILEEKDIADNTIIILMGDNGYYLGERQLAGKWLMHDNSLRVPLIIYDPRIGVHRDVQDLVLNIDITSTIVDLAEIEPPSVYQGISLLPYVNGQKPPNKRESVLVEHLWDFENIPSSEGIRTEKWKYFRYRFIDASEELYDLENDPLETVNLALESDYNVIVRELRNQCTAMAQNYSKAR